MMGTVASAVKNIPAGGRIKTIPLALPASFHAPAGEERDKP
jgi:hypothetical protein